MKTYHGYRKITSGHDGAPITSECVVQVCVNGRKRRLRPRLDIRNHSPGVKSGNGTSHNFEWGYGGSGPAQLALALVADCCGRAAAVPCIYQRVKAIVAKLPHEGWTLTEQQVRQAVADAIDASDSFNRERGIEQ